MVLNKPFKQMYKINIKHIIISTNAKTPSLPSKQR